MEREPSADGGERPRIKSLLEIDPWKDVPGCPDGPPSAKIPRLEAVPPLPPAAAAAAAAAASGPRGQENMESEQPRAIRSLLDINPFDSLASHSNRKSVKAPNVASPTTPKATGIPSLLDIDPFRGPGHASWPQNKNGSASVETTRADTSASCEQMLSAHSEDFNALLNAIQEEDCSAVVRILKTPGLSINAVVQAGERPLTLAAKNCQLAVCTALLNAGADVNLQDGVGRCPLHYLSAVAPEKQDSALLVLRPILSQGALFELRDKDGFTPLLTACQSGNQDITQALLSHADLSATANDGASALHLAARKGSLTIVRQLLNAHADVNARDTAFETPLIIAARAGDAAIVHELIQAHCDLNQQGFMEYTALHWAVHGGFEEVSHQLVQAGADLNTTSALMRTPLHRAVTAGHTNIVALLLQAGSDTERVDANGETALATAVRWGHTDIVRTLLRSQANPNGAGGRRGPLVKALCCRFKDIVHLLLSADCEVRGLRGKWLEAQDSVQEFLAQNMQEMPRSLKRLCRSSICARVGYGVNMRQRLQTLPLPEELIEFLLFKAELTEDEAS